MCVLYVRMRVCMCVWYIAQCICVSAPILCVCVTLESLPPSTPSTTRVITFSKCWAPKFRRTAGSYDLDWYSSMYHNFEPIPRCHFFHYRYSRYSRGRGTVVAAACSAQLVVVTMKVVHTSLSLDHQRLWKSVSACHVKENMDISHFRATKATKLCFCWWAWNDCQTLERLQIDPKQSKCSCDVPAETVPNEAFTSMA